MHFAGLVAVDRRAWVEETVSAAVKKILGQELGREAPLMSAGLDSLGETHCSLPQLFHEAKMNHRPLSLAQALFQ